MTSISIDAEQQEVKVIRLSYESRRIGNEIYSYSRPSSWCRAGCRQSIQSEPVTGIVGDTTVGSCGLRGRADRPSADRRRHFSRAAASQGIKRAELLFCRADAYKSSLNRWQP